MSDNIVQEQNDYGIDNIQFPGTFKLDNGQIAFNVDVADEVLSGSKTLDKSISMLNQADNFIINPKEYYYKKYSLEDNPSAESTIKRSDIDKLYDSVIFSKGQVDELKKYNLNMRQLNYHQEMSKVSPSRRLYFSLDPSHMRRAYEGQRDIRSGAFSHVATEQEMAEWQDYMYVKDATAEGGLRKIERPNLKEMREMFTDQGMVVTTIRDETNDYAPVLIAQPESDFVVRDMVYSTKYGAQATFSESKWRDFWRSATGAAWYGTGQAMSDLGMFFNTQMYYNQHNIFDTDTYVEHTKKVMQKLSDKGLFGAAKQLEKAVEARDSKEILDALNYAYASLGPTEGRELMREAQPLKFQELDKDYQAFANNMQAHQYSQSMDIAMGRGFSSFGARSGHTIGYLFPQILIGLATSGVSWGASAAATAGRAAIASALKAVTVAGRMAAMTVGSSQAFQEFYREGMEMGVPQDVLNSIGLWVLPLTSVTEYATQGWMFKNMDPSFVTQILKPIMQKNLQPLYKAAEKAGVRGLTEAEKKHWASKIVGGIINNKTFQAAFNSNTYGGGIISSVFQELAQEWTEEIGYNIARKYAVDLNLPEYFETGAGKFGQESIFPSWEEANELTFGIIFATALTEAVTGLIPLGIRKARGIKNPKTTEQQQLYMVQMSLKGESNRIREEGIKEFQKSNSMFGQKGLKLSELFPENYEEGKFTVPKNEYLQGIGLQEGAIVNDLATQNLIEFMGQVDYADNVASQMNLSKMDIAILSRYSIPDHIGLGPSIRAATEMIERRAEINGLMKSWDETEAGKTYAEGEERPTRPTWESMNNLYKTYENLFETQGEDVAKAWLSEQDVLFKKFAEYKEAETKFNHYRVIEEKTNNSKYINDLVKDIVALQNQVDDKFREHLGLKDGEPITAEMKNNKSNVDEYMYAWQKTIDEKFGYKNLNLFFNGLRREKARIDKVRQEEEDKIKGEAFSSLTERLESLEKGYSSLGSKSASERIEMTNALHKELGEFTKVFMDSFYDPNSMVSMGQLNELKDRFTTVLQQHEAALGIQATERLSEFIQPAIEAEIAYSQETVANLSQLQSEREATLISLSDEITALQAELGKELNESDRATIDAQIASKLQESQAIDELLKGIPQQMDEEDARREEAIERIKRGDFSAIEEALGDDMQSIGKLGEIEEMTDPRASLESLGKYAEGVYGYEFGFDEDSGRYDGNLPGRKQLGPNDPINMRSETEEEFENRRQEALAKLQEAKGRTSLADYITRLYEEITQALEYLESVNNGDNNFATKYPLHPYNTRDVKDNLSQISSMVPEWRYHSNYKNAFTVSRALHGDKRFEQHSTTDEQEWVAEMAKTDDKGSNEYERLYDEAITSVEKISDMLGNAESKLQKLLLAHHIEVNNMNYRAVEHILTLNLLDAQGKKLVSPELRERFKALGELPEDILQSNGEITEEQMRLVAERKRVVDDILSELQAIQKETGVVFSEHNKKRLFEMHTSYFELYSKNDPKTNLPNTTDGSVFSGSEHKAHIGKDGPATPLTRRALSKEAWSTSSLDVNGNEEFYNDFQGGHEKHVYMFSKFENASPDVVRHMVRHYTHVLSWINSGVFVNELNALRVKFYNSNERIETGEQEHVENTLAAHYTTPNNKTVTKMLWDHMKMDDLFDPKKNKRVKYTDYMFSALSIGGDYGVGKTDFVAARTYRMVSEILGKDKVVGSKGITIVGITERLRSNHKKSFAAEKAAGANFISMTEKDGFLTNLDKMPTGEGNLYIIDEASIISKNQFDKIATHFKGADAKVIFLGDMFQMKHPSSFDRVPDVMRRTMNTTLLTHQFSSNSPLLRSLAEAIRLGVVLDNHAIIFPNVTEKKVGHSKQGARYFKSAQNVYDSFMSSQNTNKAIVFATSEQYNEFLKRHPETQAQLELNKDKIFIAQPEMGELGSTERLMQGLREEEVYLMFKYEDYLSGSTKMNSKHMAAALYTGVGRASKWVGLVAADKIVDNNNVDEARALSVGNSLHQDELVQAVKEKLKPYYDIWYDSMYQEAKESTTEEKSSRKGSKQATSILQGMDLPGRPNIAYKIEDETLSYSYKNTNYTISNIDPNMDEGTIKELILDDILKNGTSNESGIAKDEPIEGGRYTTKEKEYNVGDNIAIGNAQGTITDIDVDAHTKTANITYIDIENEEKQVTINEDYTSTTEEDIDETPKDSTEELITRNKESAQKFSSDKKSGLYTFWASSASVINLPEAGDIKRVRAINDVIAQNMSLFGFNAIKTDIEYVDDKGQRKNTKAIVLAVELDPTTINNLNVLINKSEELSEMRSKMTNPSLDLFVNAQTVKDKKYEGKKFIFVGTVSEPYIPVYTSNGIEYKNAGSMTMKEVQEAFDTLIKNKALSTSEVKNLESQREYNVALAQYRDDKFMPSDKMIPLQKVEKGRRKIEYTKKRVKLNTIIENATDVSAGIMYRGDGRMVVLPKGKYEGSGYMVVSMPKFSEEGFGSPTVNAMVTKLTAERDLLSTRMKEEKPEKEEARDFLDKVFGTSVLFKLIRSNKIDLKKSKSKFATGLKQYIEFEGKSIKIKGGDDLTIQKNYQSAIDYLINDNATNLINSSMYDYPPVMSKGVYEPHSGKSFHETLYTNASRINNTQLYVSFDAAESDIVSPHDTSQSNARKRNPNAAFEMENESSPIMEELQQAEQHLEEYFGENYLESGLFFRHEGYIPTADGGRATGMVVSNAIMHLAVLDGKVRATTAHHEAFHVVYRNFVPTAMQEQLKEAARIIASLSNENIAGNEEEWMARNFADKRVAETHNLNDEDKAKVSLWERFKAFLGDIIDQVRVILNLAPQLKAQQQLNSFYDKIVDGKFANRIQDIKIDTEQNIAYESTEGVETDEQLNDEQYSEKQRASLFEAQKVKAEYDSKVSNRAMNTIINHIRVNIVQSMFTGNYAKDAHVSGRGVVETVNHIMTSYRTEMQEVFGDIDVYVRLGEELREMKVKDVVEQELHDKALALNPPKDAPSYSDARHYTDMYMMYADENMVGAIVQLSMPSLDIYNGLFDWGSPTAKTFEKSNIKPEKFLNDMTRLYLSVVPRITADGRKVQGGEAFFTFDKVNAALIEMGKLAYEISLKEDTDLLTAMTSIMRHLIQNSSIDIVNGQPIYNSEMATVAHSLYNYMFGEAYKEEHNIAENRRAVKEFILDYGPHTGMMGGALKGDYVGLMDKSVLLSYQKRTDLRNLNMKERAAALKRNNEIDKAREQITDFVISIMSIYGSYYVKTHTKGVYYGYDKMKSRHYADNAWASTTQSIKDMQTGIYLDGHISSQKKANVKNKISVGNNATNKATTLGYKFANKSKFTPIMIFDYNAKSASGNAFMIVSNDGTYVKTRPLAVSELSNYTNFINAIDALKGDIGLPQLNKATIQGILTAQSWEEVSDAIRASNIGTEEDAAYMSNVKRNYSTPIEFFTDYVGTLVSLMKSYSEDYQYTDKNGYQTYEDNTARVRRIKEEHPKLALLEIFSKVPNSNIPLNFLEKTSYAKFDKFDKELQRVLDQRGDEQSNMDLDDGGTSIGEINTSNLTYITGADFDIAHAVMASMIQRIQGLVSNKHNYNAAGEKIYNVGMRTALYDAMFNLHGETISIDGYSESLGLSRDMNIVTIGDKYVQPIDFLDYTIRTYMQEIYKNMTLPTLFIPTMPAADKGKTTLARITTNMIKTENGIFSIDYHEMGKEIASMFERVYNEVHGQRAYLDEILNRIRAFGKDWEAVVSLQPALDGDRNVAYHDYYKRKNLTNVLANISEYAHKKGMWEEVKRIFEQSPIKKDTKAISNFQRGKTVPHFGLSFQMEGDTEIVVPGRTIFNDIVGYEYMQGSGNLNGEKIVFIEKIHELATKEKLTKKELEVLEQTIHRLFEKEYKAFAKLLSDIGYEQTGTVINLNKNVEKSQQIIGSDNIQDTSTYYNGSNINFKPQKPIFSFFALSVLTNDLIQSGTVSPFSYKGYLDAVKRMGSIHTPGQSPIINGTQTIKEKQIVDGVEVEIEKKVYLGTLAKSNPAMIYGDEEINPGATYKLVNDKLVYSDEGNSFSPEDGQITISPLGACFLNRSFGGTDYTVLGNSDMKKLLNNFFTTNGDHVEIKRGDKILTGHDFQYLGYRNVFHQMMLESDMRIQKAIQSNPYLLGIEFSLGAVFEEHFNRTLDFDTAIDNTYRDIINLQYNDDGTVSDTGIMLYEVVASNIVFAHIPVSAVKSAPTVMNSYNRYGGTAELAMIEIDNSTTKAIQNPSQEVSLNKLQAFPSQVESFLGNSADIEVQGLTEEYFETKRQLQQHLMDELVRDISKQKDKNGARVAESMSFDKIDWSTMTNIETGNVASQEHIDRALEQLEVYYRSRVVNNLSVSGENLAYVDLFLDNDVSMNLPMMRQRFVQTFLNDINKIIQGRTTGSRVTQQAGRHVMLYEDTSTGRVYQLEEALEVFRAPESILNYQGYATGQVDEYLFSKGLKMRGLKDMDIDENGNTVAGEIIIGNHYADRFGFKPGDTINKIASVRYKGEDIAYKDFLKVARRISSGKEVIASVDMIEIFDSPMMRQAIKNSGIERRILKDTGKETIDNISVELANYIESTKQHRLIGQLAIEASNLAREFNDMMEIFLSRVPATGLSSGGVYRVVGFHNNGSTVYIPSKMAYLADSDFDIDALTTYMDDVNSKGRRITDVNAVDSEGKPLAGKSMIYRNKLNELRKKILLHKGSQVNLFTPIGASGIAKTGERLSNIDNKPMMNGAPTSIYESYKRNMAGAQSIGILANTVTGISYMLANLNKGTVVTSGHLSDVLSVSIDSNNNPIVGPTSAIARLGAWQQAGLDNAKMNVFGMFNIPQEVVNILGVYAMTHNDVEIYNFFNNPHISNLIQSYTSGTSIKESRAKYDLYHMAMTKRAGLYESAKRYRMNSFDALNSKSPLSTQLDRANLEAAREAIAPLVDEIYSELLDTLQPLVKYLYRPKGKGETKYFKLGTNEQEEFERWMINEYGSKLQLEYLFNDNSTTEILGSKTEFFEEMDMLIEKFAVDNPNRQKEIGDKIKDSIKAIAELKVLESYITGYNDMKTLADLDVTASAMFRVSQFMKLRTEMPVLDVDFFRLRKQLELSLGMTLDNFLSWEATDRIDVLNHIGFFVNNNEQYNALKDPKDAALKASLLEKEELIAKEINIPLFIKGLPVIHQSLTEYVRQKNIKSEMFIVDNEVIATELKDKFLELQHRKEFRYAQEISEFNNIVTDLAIDNYFQITGTENSDIPSLTLPYRVAEAQIGWSRVEGENKGRLNLSEWTERQEFSTGFPEYINALIAHKSDIQYVKALSGEFGALSNIELAELSNNLFLNSLEFKPFNNTLKLKDNTADMSADKLAKLKDSFNSLPKVLQTMFVNYELIRHRLNYRQGGILQVIGVEYLKGELSDVFNHIHRDIKTKGLAAFSPEALNTVQERNEYVTELQERVFDFLGTNTTFANFKKKPFFKADPTNEMYVFSYEEEGRRVFYKNDEVEGYKEHHRISNALTASRGSNITAMSSVFRASQEEIDALNRGDTSIRHEGSTTLYGLKTGDYRVTHTGVLVKVTSKNNYGFTYTKVLEEQLPAYKEAIRKRTEADNVGITLYKDTELYNMIHPEAVREISFESFPALDSYEFSTVNSKGQEYSYKMFTADDKFNSIDELINEAKLRAIMTIDHYVEFFSRPENKGKENSPEYMWVVYYNLPKDIRYLESRSETEDVDDRIKQYKAAALFIHETLPIMIKDVIKNNIDQYIASSKNPDIATREISDINRYDSRFSSDIENKFIGFRRNYGALVRRAIRERFGQVSDTDIYEKAYKAKDSTFDTYLRLYDELKGEYGKQKKAQEGIESAYIETEELLEKGYTINKAMRITDNKQNYELAVGALLGTGEDNVLLARLGQLNGIFNKRKYQVSQATREKAFTVGRITDNFGRRYMQLWSEVNLKGNESIDLSIVELMDPEGKVKPEQYVDKESLKEVMDLYLQGIKLWSDRNGYKMEILMDEFMTYQLIEDESLLNKLNELLDKNEVYTDEFGIPESRWVNGIATAQDMTIRLHKEGTHKDILIDMKTVSSSSTKDVFITSRDYNEQANVRSLHREWGFQLLATSSMLSNTHGTNYQYLTIMPFMKYQEKGKPVTFKPSETIAKMVQELESGVKTQLPLLQVSTGGNTAKDVEMFIDKAKPIKGVEAKYNSVNNDIFNNCK